MHLSEPVTTLTDYALAAISLGFAISLARLIGPSNRVSGLFWCAAFAAASTAAVCGGTRHGFVDSLDPAMLQLLWSAVMFSVGAAGAFVMAAIHSADVCRKDGTVEWLVYGLAVTLVGAVVQQGRFLRTGYFNHNDAYHVIQIVGLYCLFRCAKTVHDRPGVEPEVITAAKGSGR